ncbi:hypothetical protein EZV62_024043 [Acer yangbiense]|uniref:CCHC-type domain-containing protein n=1 Tax=Acer yangbiense TaxID=1000413 RepID=A0A5C7H473_9ROSI|nr:hypothetical protein EZV62_024043 [Acer yangbiense]
MMNADEVAQLCPCMTLKDREGPVRTLKSNLKEAVLQRLANSLVGKVLSPKIVHRDGFKAVMKKIWQTRDGVEIETVDGNIFTFQFGNTEDKKRIISGGPWCFNDALIVMEEPRGMGNVQHMKFNKAEFWVQIHNAPLICMSEEIRRFLGCMIGEVMDFDGDVLGDGVESVMLIKYERLPNFCFRCGLLGHTMKDCPEKPKNLENKKEEFLFGFWMHAIVPHKGGYGGRRWTADGWSTKDASNNRGNWRMMSRKGAGREDGRRLPSMEVVENGGNQIEPCLESRLIRKEISVTKASDCNTRLEGVPDFLVDPKLAESYGLDNLNLNSNQKRVTNNVNPGVSLGDNIVGLSALTGPMSPSISTGLLESGFGLVKNTEALTHPNEVDFRTDQDPQFSDGNPNLTSKWKRRARDQHRIISSGSSDSGGHILGKKKEGGGTGGNLDVQKKQRLVSSTEDSTDADVDLILSIPPSSLYTADYLVWHFEQSGSYSVRSGYRRGMALDGRCPRCHNQQESMVHAL